MYSYPMIKFLKDLPNKLAYIEATSLNRKKVVNNFE